MKRILNILLIFTLILTMSIPAYAWSSDNPYENVSGLDVLNNAPVLFEGGDGILYDASSSTYYGFGGYEGMSYGHFYKVDSQSGALTINNYSSGQLQVWKWDGSRWTEQQIYSTWNMDGYTFVNCSRNFFIDDMQLQWDGYTLTFNGEVINPPSGGDSGGTDTPTTPDDDIDNSGLLSGLTDFISGLFQGFLDLISFLWTVIEKLGQLVMSLLDTLRKIPELITSIDELFGVDGSIMVFLNNIFPEDNSNAQNCLMVVLLIFSYGIFSFFYSLIKRFMFK